MKSNLLFFLIIVSFVVSILYLVWKVWTVKQSERDVERRMLHYFLLHILVALQFFLLVVGMLVIRFHGRHGTYGWMLDSPSTVESISAVLAVWGIGVFGTVVWWALQHIRDILRYRERTGVPEHVTELIDSIAKDMGYPKLKGKAWLVYGLESPELGGWFRPVVYLPLQEYDDEALNNIITHELVHFIYGDKLFRELGMLVLCLYWFNPLTRSMVRQLKLWDEYHCDYQVCGYEHIDRESYICTLCQTVMKAYENNLLNPCFKEEGSDIVKRLQFIRQYTKINHKKWIATVMTLTAVFTLLGSSTALAAGTTMNMAVNEVAMATAVHDQEIDLVENELVEYTMTEDDLNGANIIYGESISPYAIYSFNFELGNDVYQTPGFRATTGQVITVQTLFDPSNINIKVGIVQPNGVWRYVINSGQITHSFDVTMNGTHKVFVWNETTTPVTVVGGYRLE